MATAGSKINQRVCIFDMYDSLENHDCYYANAAAQARIEIIDAVT